MIAGLNLRVEHEGRPFDIQVEDLGEAGAASRPASTRAAPSSGRSR